MEYCRYNRSLYDIYKLCVTRVSPNALIELCPPENKKTERCVKWRESRPCMQIGRSNQREHQVKSQPQRHNIGDVNCHKVIHNKKHCHIQPVPLEQTRFLPFLQSISAFSETGYAFLFLIFLFQSFLLHLILIVNVTHLKRSCVYIVSLQLYSISCKIAILSHSPHSA